MVRTILFQLHWFLGLTAGLVLAVIGLTGAAMSFEDEVHRLVNPGVVTVPVTSAPLLTLPALVERVQSQRPDKPVMRVRASMWPGRAVEVRLEPRDAGSGTRETLYVHPGTGRILGEAHDEAAFDFIENVHRFLVLPGEGDGWGRQITGFSTLALIFFALSGLYLRWPRRPLDWRSWLVLDLRLTGRSLYRALHAVVGGWVFALYLLSGFTGLWWSYGWYGDALRAAFASKQAEADPVPAGPLPQPAAALRVALSALDRERRGQVFEALDIRLPERDPTVQIEALPRGARHAAMADLLTLDGTTGAVLGRDFHADRPSGQALLDAMFELHSGQYFGLAGRIALFLSSAAMPLFTITGYLLYLSRRKRQRSARSVADGKTSVAVGGDIVPIFYASQTGGAELLARRAASALPGGVAMPLGNAAVADLTATSRALFVLSTYGEGEPPDSARRFARRVMAIHPELSQLRYALLSLGDRNYPDYCAFGRTVDAWLSGHGATRLFDTIEVDREDGLALARWHAELERIGGQFLDEGSEPPGWTEWNLSERRLLNPGSDGAFAYHIALTPPQSTSWQAGDLAEIELDGARRQYSIASIPSSGRVDLIVRQVRSADGKLGLGSGWLTERAMIDDRVSLRLRSNPAFRQPDDIGCRMILIGTGTGLAGLLAHVRHRAETGGAPIWLIHGERRRAYDAFHHEELEHLLRAGVIARLDRCWSRDSDCSRYVQNVVRNGADDIRLWIGMGAAVYLCGSLDRMAPVIDRTLRDILGDTQVDALKDARLYCRDVY